MAKQWSSSSPIEKPQPPFSNLWAKLTRTKWSSQKWKKTWYCRINLESRKYQHWWWSKMSLNTLENRTTWQTSRSISLKSSSILSLIPRKKLKRKRSCNSLPWRSLSTRTPASAARKLQTYAWSCSFKAQDKLCSTSMSILSCHSKMTL